MAVDRDAVVAWIPDMARVGTRVGTLVTQPAGSIVVVGISGIAARFRGFCFRVN